MGRSPEQKPELKKAKVKIIKETTKELKETIEEALPVKISASILSANLSNLGEEALRCALSGADLLHIDVMDGQFTENLTFGNPVVASLKKNRAIEIPYDVHLMVERPFRLISKMAEAGIGPDDYITIHAESRDTTAQCIAEIKRYGIKAGIAVSPMTPVEAFFPFLDKLDLVLIMTVTPGAGAQPLIPETIPKIKALSDRLKTLTHRPEIEADGGINHETAKLVKEAGAGILVAGSYLFRAEIMEEAINALRFN